ncbi:MAG TPA: amidohydrolase family protein [Lysobacter sp.]
MSLRPMWAGSVLTLLVGVAQAAQPAGAPKQTRFTQDPYPSTYQAIAAAPVLIQHATVLDGTGRRLDDADVLMRDGRIVAVGTALEAPADAVRVDGTGKWVTPGIIDVHSHLGVYPSPGVSAHSDGNEATSPVTPNVWAEHSIWPQDPGFATALAGAINGDIRVHIHCYRADEMATMLDLAKEFGFKIAAFHHGVEAYKLADRLAAEGVCGALWADWWGFKMEAFDGIQENIALVDRPANSCAIVHSDSEEGIQRLNQEAAKVMAHAKLAGMDIAPERAIRWLTQNPAKALGILNQTGTLENGKMADVVVWNRDPFSVYAKAEQVYIDGARIYDRNDATHQPKSDFMLGQGVTGGVR